MIPVDLAKLVPWFELNGNKIIGASRAGVLAMAHPGNPFWRDAESNPPTALEVAYGIGVFASLAIIGGRGCIDPRTSYLCVAVVATTPRDMFVEVYDDEGIDLSTLRYTQDQLWLAMVNSTTGERDAAFLRACSALRLIGDIESELVHVKPVGGILHEDLSEAYDGAETSDPKLRN